MALYRHDIAIRELLDNPQIHNPLAMPRFNQHVKEKEVEYDQMYNGQAAFLGPVLWERTLEYMDLDEFLEENGIPANPLPPGHPQAAHRPPAHPQMCALPTLPARPALAHGPLPPPPAHTQRDGPPRQAPVRHAPQPPAHLQVTPPAHPQVAPPVKLPIIKPPPPPPQPAQPQVAKSPDALSAAAALPHDFKVKEEDTSSSCSNCSLPELITGLTTSKVVSEVMPDDDKSDISDDNDSSDGSDDPTPAKVKCHRPDSMDSTDDQDLLFATIPGQENFDPAARIFTAEELRPQPLIKKSQKVFISDDLKDSRYWTRRRKNNLAAKRSRDARRIKENQITMRAAFLESECADLRHTVSELQRENADLHKRIDKVTAKVTAL